MGFLAEKAKKRKLEAQDRDEILAYLSQNVNAIDSRDAKLSFEYAVVNGHEWLVSRLLSINDIFYFAEEEGEPIDCCPMGHLLSGTLEDGTVIKIDQPFLNLLEKIFDEMLKNNTEFQQNVRPQFQLLINDLKKRILLLPSEFKKADGLFMQHKYNQAFKIYESVFKTALANKSNNLVITRHCFMRMLDCIIKIPSAVSDEDVLRFLKDQVLFNWSQSMVWKDRKSIFTFCLKQLSYLNMNAANSLKSFMITLIAQAPLDDDDLKNLLTGFKKTFVAESEKLLSLEVQVLDQCLSYHKNPDDKNLRDLSFWIEELRTTLFPKLLQGRGQAFFDPRKINDYRFFAIVCYRITQLLKPFMRFNKFYQSDAGYEAFYWRCCTDAALIGHVKACRDLADYYKARGRWGRAILFELRACSDFTEAKDFLAKTSTLKTEELLNDRQRKRKILCKYLSNLDEENLPHGPMAISRLGNFQEKFIGTENLGLKTRFFIRQALQATYFSLSGLIANADFSWQFIKGLTERQVAERRYNIRRPASASVSLAAARSFQPSVLIPTHSAKPEAPSLEPGVQVPVPRGNIADAAGFFHPLSRALIDPGNDKEDDIVSESGQKEGYLSDASVASEEEGVEGSRKVL